MRIASSVTAVSWIPREAVEGMYRLPFTFGVAHYDQPPPDQLGDLDDWRARDLFREANELRAYIEVEQGRITGYGHEGRGLIGTTKVKVGPSTVDIPGQPMPVLRPEPDVGADHVRFVQTVGGRTGMPAPRTVPRKPYFQFASATAWTTLALTIRADGSSDWELAGASPFPRHWIYDRGGRLAAESGTVDSTTWLNDAFGARTPWGDYDSRALVTGVESALERELMAMLTRTGAGLQVRDLAAGRTLLEQGDAGDEVYLLLDGVFSVEVDRSEVARVSPGAILGERAPLEGGRRTATLRALTDAKVGLIALGHIDGQEMAAIAAGHRREEEVRG